jgi:hypothetical protein
LDKRKPSEKNTCQDRLKKHQFAVIDASAPLPGCSSPTSDSRTFKSGLALSPDGGLSAPATDCCRPPETEGASAPEKRDRTACVWDQFRVAVQQLATEKDKTFEQAATETLQLSLAISQKILNAQPDIDLKKTHDLVHTAWQNIRREHRLRLNISPQDLDDLKQIDAAWVEDADKGFVFHEDAALEHGALRAEGPPLDVQGLIFKQLPRIERDFTSRCLTRPDRGRTRPPRPAAAGGKTRPGIPFKGRP